jgi:hypothetical protein
MRRILILATAALTLAGAIAVSGPAAAQYRRDYRDRDRDRHGDAVAAGVLGFALGAAVGGSNNNRYGSRGYYDRGYYGQGPRRGYGYGYPSRGYAYGYGYRQPRRCVVERRWDPYYGRSVRYERCW